MAVTAASKTPAEKLPPRTIKYVAISRKVGHGRHAIAQLVSETLGWHDYSRNLREHVADWYHEPRLKLDLVDKTRGNWAYGVFGT